MGNSEMKESPLFSPETKAKVDLIGAMMLCAERVIPQHFSLSGAVSWGARYHFTKGVSCNSRDLSHHFLSVKVLYSWL